MNMTTEKCSDSKCFSDRPLFITPKEIEAMKQKAKSELKAKFNELIDEYIQRVKKCMNGEEDDSTDSWALSIICSFEKLKQRVEKI